MKAWKVFSAFIFIAILAYGVFVTFLNYELLKTPFKLTHSRFTSVGIFILLVFLLGFILMGFRYVIESWRRERDLRKYRKQSREEQVIKDLVSFSLWKRLNGDIQGMNDLLEKHSDREHPLLDILKLEQAPGSGEEGSRIQKLRSANRKYPESQALAVALSNELVTRGELEEAETILNSLDNVAPFEAHIMAARRNLAVARKNWKECIALQKKIMALSASEPSEKGILVGLQYEQARDLFEKAHRKPALTILKTLQRDYPKFVPAWVLCGDIYIKDDEPEKAIGVWKNGFYRTHATILLHRISQYHLEAEQPEKSIEAITEIVYNSENDIIPRFFLGRLYYRLEMHEDALREFDHLRPRVFKSPTFNYLCGVVEEKLGHPDRANDAYRRAISEISFLKTEYFCLNCQKRFQDWSDRCTHCGSWNSIEVDYPEEKARPADLGLDPFPIRFPTS